MNAHSLETPLERQTSLRPMPMALMSEEEREPPTTLGIVESRSTWALLAVRQTFFRTFMMRTRRAIFYSFFDFQIFFVWIMLLEPRKVVMTRT